MRRLIKYMVFIYIVCGILFIPFQFDILPFGFPSMAKILVSPLQRCFDLPHTSLLFYSDSLGLYLLMGSMLIVSVTIAIILKGVESYLDVSLKPKLGKLVREGITFYLALMMIEYGVSKIMGQQFYFPYANTLFTPVGFLTKDFLFWTAMGTSYSYSVVLGLIEVSAAVLLWFHKTRRAGLLLCLIILSHIVLINFSFNLDIKLFSVFLLLIALTLFQPYAKSLILYVFGVSLPKEQRESANAGRANWMQGIWVVAVLITVVEGCWPYFNYEGRKDSHLNEAWAIENANRYKRIFFHPDGYVIIQHQSEHMISMPYTVSSDSLYAGYDGNKSLRLEVDKNGNDQVFSGTFFGEEVYWQTKKINLEDISLHDNFYWYFPLD